MWQDHDKQYHTAQVNPTNKYVFWQTAKIQMKLVTSKYVFWQKAENLIKMLRHGLHCLLRFVDKK